MVKAHAVFVANDDKLDELFNSYSCWFKLRKGIAWILLFGRWIASHNVKGSHSFRSKTQLAVRVLKTGEGAIVTYLQNKFYQDEMKH